MSTGNRREQRTNHPGPAGFGLEGAGGGGGLRRTR